MKTTHILAALGALMFNACVAGPGDHESDQGTESTGGDGAAGGHAPGGTSANGGSAGAGAAGGGGAPISVPVPGLSRAWAVNDGEKVEKDDLSHPAQQQNSAWSGEKIKLFGARNEIVAFQLVVESDGSGIDGLTVSLPEIAERGGDAKITYQPPGSDPTDYVGRPIQVFVENYMNVEEASTAGWVYDPDGPAAPSDPTGWKPVQLVPENAKEGRGGLPIDVPPQQNQAFWFDVYIPKGLPAGMYDGWVHVTAGGGDVVIPVELEVLGFELPDQNGISAMLYFESDQVELYQGHGLDDRYHRFAHRNRVELVNAYDANSANAALGRFSGDDFTAANGYEGPGAGHGNRLAPASFYGPGSKYDTKSSAWQSSDAWMNFMASKLPGVETFLYMPDEPGSGEYAYIEQIASNIHSNPGPGKGLSIFVTSSYKQALDGSIDIWCASAGGFDPAKAEQERAKGHQYWFYNGHRPDTGAMTIDTPATDARVNAWAAYKHGVEVYFYWHSDHWKHNHQKEGDKIQNVWENPITFDNRKSGGGGSFINGDGVLMYPGEEVLHPEQDRGIVGPISTIQLANLRRGLQDALYLAMARDKGLDAEVDDAIESVVPAMFTDAGSSVSFAEHGDAFEDARHAIGLAIAAAP